MSFKNDVFISYAHIDNESLDGGEGWTTSLHKRLRLRLHQLLGEKLEIWFDEQEQGSQYLVGLVGAGISDTLLLTTVLTPRYASSEWCRGELGEFCRHADQTGGVYQNGVSRIFCAVKTPVPPERIPEELTGLRRYEFYEVDANNKVREFSPESGPQKDQKYWDKFEDLAQGIKLAVEKLKPKPEAAPGAGGPAARKESLFGRHEHRHEAHARSGHARAFGARLLRFAGRSASAQCSGFSGCGASAHVELLALDPLDGRRLRRGARW